MSRRPIRTHGGPRQRHTVTQKDGRAIGAHLHLIKVVGQPRRAAAQRLAHPALHPPEVGRAALRPRRCRFRPAHATHLAIAAAAPP